MSNLTLNSNTSVMNPLDIMEKSWKFAPIVAKSDIIPLHYRNKPENVFIAMQTAYRMNLDPMMIMQNTFIVTNKEGASVGKLGMNSSFAISLANNSGLFASGIRYRIEGTGDNLRVTAYYNLKKTNDEISFTIGMKEAIAEGWTKNPKYRSLPELMLCYRAATLLLRTHAPEVLNGMHTVEELEDIRDVSPVVAKEEKEIKKTESKTQALSSKLDAMLDDENMQENISETVEEKGIELQVNINNIQAELQALVLSKHIPQEMVSKWCQKAGVSELSELDEEKTLSCIEFIQDKYEKDLEII
jgi:hypothetical protein